MINLKGENVFFLKNLFPVFLISFVFANEQNFDFLENDNNTDEESLPKNIVKTNILENKESSSLFKDKSIGLAEKNKNIILKDRSFDKNIKVVEENNLEREYEKLEKVATDSFNSNVAKDDFIDIYAQPEEVSSEWKSNIAEQFYKDIAVIKQVVLDGEKDNVAKDKFLKSFREQQDWFDINISSTQFIGDSSYKEVKEKRFFIGRIANAQRRSDKYLNELSKKVLYLDSISKKKVRLDVLADINTYVLEEMKRGLTVSKDSFLSDKIIKKILNENLKEFRKPTFNGSNFNPAILNSINLGIGKLITKDEYQNFSKALRTNISTELKEIFSKIEENIHKRNAKNNSKINQDYTNLLSTLDNRISSTEARLQVYIDKKIGDLGHKIDLLTKKEQRRRGIIDLENVENNMKSYFDQKIQDMQSNLAISGNNKKEQKVKSIFNISKKNIDKKIYDEVGKQLSALKESRIKKFEKLSRNKKKAERRKLLRELLEKELNRNFN